MSATRFRVLRIHCPVSKVGLARLQAGEAEAIADEGALAAIVAIVRDSDVLGRIGAYRGVFELGFALEGFVPGDGAVPTTGRIGAAEIVPCAVLKTYAAIDADIDAALAAIVAAHPWEVPVIEIGEVMLAT